MGWKEVVWWELSWNVCRRFGTIALTHTKSNAYILPQSTLTAEQDNLGFGFLFFSEDEKKNEEKKKQLFTANAVTSYYVYL